MKNKILSGLTIICFMGCMNVQSQQPGPLDEFQSTSKIQLRGRKINLVNDSILVDPRTITVIDSFGILYDNDAKSAYSVVNLNTGKLNRRFGFSGDSPEKMNITGLKLNTAFENNSISILELNPPFRIFLYNVDSLFKLKEYNPHYYMKMPDKLYLGTSIFLDEKRILGKNSFPSVPS